MLVGHSGDGNDGNDGNNGGDGDGDVRGYIAEVERYAMLIKQGCTQSTTPAPAQPLNSLLTCGLHWGGE